MARGNRGPATAVYRWQALGTIALVILAASTAGLVWAASTNGRDVEHGQTAIPIPEFTPTGSPTPEIPLAVPPQARIIVPTGGSTAWRTSSLGCAPGSAATIEATEDAGATWTAYPLAEVAAVAILAIEPLDGVDTVGVVTQSGEGCTLGYDISFTGGEFWRSEPDAATEVPYSVPGEGALRAGTARFAVQCGSPADFAVRNSNEAVVICEDGVVRTTADAAVTWQHPEVDALAVAATPVDRGYLIAEVRHAECPGIRLVVLRASDAGEEPRACLTAFDETDPIELAASGQDVWAWIGSEVAVSRDGGLSWPAAWQPGPEPAPEPTPEPTPSGE